MPVRGPSCKRASQDFLLGACQGENRTLAWRGSGGAAGSGHREGAGSAAPSGDAPRGRGAQGPGWPAGTQVGCARRALGAGSAARRASPGSARGVVPPERARAGAGKRQGGAARLLATRCEKGRAPSPPPPAALASFALSRATCRTEVLATMGAPGKPTRPARRAPRGITFRPAFLTGAMAVSAVRGLRKEGWKGRISNFFFFFC